MATNREGLTRDEWLAAALLNRGGIEAFQKLATVDRNKLINAWKAGADPTEYAASECMIEGNS